MNSVAVIGAGAWGTALAIQSARAGNAVTLWVRDPARAREIDAARESPRLPGARLTDVIRVTAEMPEADAVLLAVPMQHLRGIAALVPPGCAPLVACAKGVEQGTLRLPLEMLDELHPGRPAAVLTGPNFAREIAAGKPAATVLAAADPALRARLAGLLGTPAFRIYGNDDPIGAQIGGAAKNVVAIAAGAVIGAGLGENARAGLITRGLAELGRLAVALGGRAETVMGLSGLGDLLLTCTSAASRNFSLGLALGRGEALGTVLA
ncbi:MAG: NAD(P)H-dependent glycerol-3-phosphate dehydrogenase, partial [Acetobacteraceae bacterium]|nr:NAD(P)H-dependent glycerol-3-phosphate dehydrogenase [Acetobacteraceae bacterium]